MATLLNVPLVNGLQKTLDAQLDSGTTASVTLNNTTNIQSPGVFVVNRIDANGNEKSASEREFIKFTGVSGNTLTGLTRNADGGTSDQDHAVGSIVEFVADVVWAQALADVIETEHNSDGTHASTIVKTTATQTLTNKTLTSPTVNSPTMTSASTDDIQVTGVVYTDTIEEKTNNTGVTVDGLLIKDGTYDFPACSVKNSSNLSIPSRADPLTLLTFNAEKFDYGDMHSTTTNTSRITIPSGQSGIYLIIFYSKWQSSSTGYRRAELHKNGSDFAPFYLVNGESAGLGVHIFTSSLIAQLSAGDYVEVYVSQTSGGDLTLYDDTCFSVAKIR